jgi:hypothetical protein
MWPETVVALLNSCPDVGDFRKIGRIGVLGPTGFQVKTTTSPQRAPEETTSLNCDQSVASFEFSALASTAGRIDRMRTAVSATI